MDCESGCVQRKPRRPVFVSLVKPKVFMVVYIVSLRHMEILISYETRRPEEFIMQVCMLHRLQSKSEAKIFWARAL